ncbi:hypothetical protein [Caulobacter sp. 17J65-9]|uniref:hypothetical protein n=1 Tax=Caulobacter sp. 17J65-9 TaxID=2709382 RepID=UPI0013CC110E|nr:hypothetical protein [Caulobacter sp. 17J65-9]NEX91467.1 hypothetical protein [Caulobacter sp. 17J65-9]
MAMRQYQRLMRRDGQTLHPTDEQIELHAVLGVAPGATDVEIVGGHPKGGYRVTFDLSPECIDEFIAHLERHGWMAVM